MITYCVYTILCRLYDWHEVSYEAKTTSTTVSTLEFTVVVVAFIGFGLDYIMGRRKCTIIQATTN